jgi:voltage-dependent potassium channel beta subunit
MEYRRMGSTGLNISVISLGAWLTYGSDKVSQETATACIEIALDGGINFFDIADAYAKGKAEESVGKIIKAKKLDRTKLVISTKAFFPMSDDVNDRGLSRKHLFESVHKSLKRLGTDYLDIFFCHRYDMNTRTEETVRALDDLIRQGKILYWGTSMWTAAQLHDAVSIAQRYHAYAPTVEQPRYNMLDRQILEGDLEDTLTELGIGTVVYSPLAGGVLTGKYNETVPEDSRAATHTEDWMQENFSPYRIEKARQITALAQSIGTTPSALALAWALRHPNVDSVITGASKPEHVMNNLKALEVTLTPEIEMQIEDILQNRPLDSSRVIVNPDEIPAL